MTRAASSQAAGLAVRGVQYGTSAAAHRVPSAGIGCTASAAAQPPRASTCASARVPPPARDRLPCLAAGAARCPLRRCARASVSRGACCRCCSCCLARRAGRRATWCGAIPAGLRFFVAQYFRGAGRQSARHPHSSCSVELGAFAACLSPRASSGLWRMYCNPLAAADRAFSAAVPSSPGFLACLWQAQHICGRCLTPMRGVALRCRASSMPAGRGSWAQLCTAAWC